MAVANSKAEENQGVHNFIQDMINQGEAEVDNKGNVKISKSR